MEMLIEKTKGTYYEALQNSSIEWHNDQSDYASFVRYYLGVVLKGYNEFQEPLLYLPLTTCDISDVLCATLCPDISETTIERTLKELLEAGFIEKVGKGRATGYAKK